MEFELDLIQGAKKSVHRMYGYEDWRDLSHRH